MPNGMHGFTHPVAGEGNRNADTIIRVRDSIPRELSREGIGPARAVTIRADCKLSVRVDARPHRASLLRDLAHCVPGAGGDLLAKVRSSSVMNTGPRGPGTYALNTSRPFSDKMRAPSSSTGSFGSVSGGSRKKVTMRFAFAAILKEECGSDSSMS